MTSAGSKMLAFIDIHALVYSKKRFNILYWILQYTWGIILTIIGHIVELALLVSGHKPKKYGLSRYYEVGNNWGGLEFGTIFIVNKNPNKHILDHELGHNIQNSIFGPFQVIIWIVSALRYWIREFMVKVCKKKLKHDYDDIWFEYSATCSGNTYITMEEYYKHK